ncbi:hypothetical protein B0H10DRAFT_2238288 [Mycena sp. CBHHK59/15]|nr:hypothetical protein B0H10DRAFT_2238288 [Mycena sp. CBHHK59/15]
MGNLPDSQHDQPQHPAKFEGQYSPSSRSSSTDPFGQGSRGHRYTPYPATAMPPPRRQSTTSRRSLTLDIPSLALHDRWRAGPSPSQTMGPVVLPEIQPPAKGNSRSMYTLPPVSALEELRGVDTQDSAAVLRRLQSDDDDTYSKSGRDTVDQDWRGWHHGAHSPLSLPNYGNGQMFMTTRSLYRIGPKFQI